MMKRCSQCHAGFSLFDSAILWLCPVCGKWGETKSYAQDDRYHSHYIPSSTERAHANIVVFRQKAAKEMLAELVKTAKQKKG